MQETCWYVANSEGKGYSGVAFSPVCCVCSW